MVRSRRTPLLTSLISISICAVANPAGAQDQEAVSLAVLPLPAAVRAEATVLGQVDGSYVTLREGTGDFVCVADDRSDEAFHVACYHRSLDDYMARGRALREEGLNRRESIALRWEEIDAGTLRLPDHPATLYSLSARDPASVKPHDLSSLQRLTVVYVPYATAEQTGLPTSPEAGVPWLMFPGKPTAHLMIHN